MASMYFRPHLLAMEAYHPPLSGRLDSGRLLLDFNERVRPLPDVVLSTLAQWCEGGSSWCYPEYPGLEEAIAGHVGCAVDEVFVGNGSDQLLDCVMRAVIEPGAKVLVPSPSFAMYGQLAKLAQGETVTYSTLNEDTVAPLEAAMAEDVRLAVVCNPNNPTAGFMPPQALRELFARYPNTWFLVDEAYMEFSGESVLLPGESLPNVVVTRTFSKAFGLAGLRMGFMVAPPEMNEHCSKIRGPYDVNRLGTVAVMSVLEHSEAVLAYRDEVVEKAKPMLEEKLRAMGLRFFPSRANFLLVMNPPSDLVAFLDASGIRVRQMRQTELKGAFRISVGDVPATREAIEALEAYASREGG